MKLDYKVPKIWHKGSMHMVRIVTGVDGQTLLSTASFPLGRGSRGCRSLASSSPEPLAVVEATFGA